MVLKESLQKIKSKDCVIEIYGMGYVGFPLSVRLAISGFRVQGVDKDSKKIDRIQKEDLQESELYLKDEFTQASHNGHLIFSQNPTKTAETRIGIICVPTPIPSKTTSSDVFVRNAVENFLEIAKNGDLIIVESSIEVGTTDELAKIIEQKGFKVGTDIGLCFCPERVDPQNTKWKLDNIPRIIYCSDDLSYEIAKEVYRHVNNSHLIRLDSSKIAEVVKSFENSFRLVNISLVNELAILCDKLKINVKDVLDAASSKPFGFMPFYPSAGAGGHCIPKDPRFLLESAKKHGVSFDALENALSVNSFLPKYIADSIENSYNELNLDKSIIVCGLSYKPNIEDMRDSPGFKILNELIKRNFKTVAYDPFYKPESSEKYKAENHIEDLDFKTIIDLNNDSIQGFNGICIVQHHTKIKLRLNEIYKNSEVSFIYDCQSNLKTDPKSQTHLKGLGS